ncbi:piggyBac transposable element-derived protein 3-like [Portunus trituberculatus]|uniref:piggyBac transposable element-derived protein 3-like n=1 Tax=Portunus trituberculatus TaxID=210409 RepID=UPI001E1CEEC1|nr:piggyBac transposable element-derived protein 3-like [Portunus trituberculatus]
MVQPELINTYNKGMGGVDLHDWLIGKYGIAIRGKKWYWCLLTRMIDMTIINSWLLHRLVSDEPITLLEFHRQIAVSYLKAAAVNREKPRFTSSLGLPTPWSLRRDGVQHFITRIGDSKRLRCQLVG